MKETKTILLAIMTLISSTVFAGETPGIPKRLEESFGKIFPGVTTHDWVVKEEFYIAEFRKNEIKHFAYFDTDGALVATVRDINTDYMPFRTLNVLKGKYGDLGKMSALEVSRTNGENFYIIELVHNNRFKNIKVYMDGTTETLKKY